MTLEARSAHTDLTVDQFAERVNLACADLPEPVRRRLMADLDSHLRELAEHGDLVETVGTPEDYARELREALELPSAGLAVPGSSTSDESVAQPRRAWRRHPWLTALAAVGTLLITAIVLIAVLLINSGSNIVHTDISAVPTTVRIAVVPTVVGKDAVAARAELEADGFVVEIETVQSTLPAGTVVSQMSPGYSEVAPGSVVRLEVSGA